MPMYDRRCTGCEKITLDCWEPMTFEAPLCSCGKATARVWIQGSSSSVIGDECDVQMKHGLCNPDGSPKRYTSKADMARDAKKAGLTNYVVHKGTKGGDKSSHTSRWI